MIPQHIESEKGFGSTETIQEKIETQVLNFQQELINNADIDNFEENHSNQRNSQEIQSLKGSWTYQEQIQLYKLHDELGNKWSMIAEYFQNRNDNSVKNHFYSRLRKALRRLNKIISVQMKKSMKEIKNNVIYKIIEVTEEKHKVSSQDVNSHQVTELCRELKARLLNFSYDQIQTGQQQNDFYSVGKQLIEDLVNFNRQYRRKAKKTNNEVKEMRMIPNKIKKFEKQKQENIFISISQCSLFESQSSENQNNAVTGHQVVTRKRAKSGEFRTLKRLESGTSAPILQSKQSFSKQQFQSFFKDSNLLESNLIFMPEMLKKESKDIHISFDKIMQDVSEFKFFDENEEQQEKIDSQDHFSDPFLNQGNFILFK